MIITSCVLVSFCQIRSNGDVWLLLDFAGYKVIAIYSSLLYTDNIPVLVVIYVISGDYSNGESSTKYSTKYKLNK